MLIHGNLINVKMISTKTAIAALTSGGR